MRPQILIAWDNLNTCPPKQYTCGHCGLPLASNQGFNGQLHTGVRGEKLTGSAHIYTCHFCTRPTFFDSDGKQVPGLSYGLDVTDIDDASVRDLYNEARRATSANCNTAAVLCCRKLLMHVAVAKGAKEGEGFALYVDYLASKGYVPPDAVACMDHIRKRANEANHEINIMGADDAEELLDYVGILLKLIYEFPATMRKKHLSSEAK